MTEAAFELTEEVNELYDFYGQLLTKKQGAYFELYYSQDYSLGEIADHFHVSRQAVYDNLKRTVQLLRRYEDNLHMIATFHQQEKLVDQLAQLTRTHYQKDAQLRALVQQFEDLLDSQ